jgi:hypothetical protein
MVRTVFISAISFTAKRISNVSSNAPQRDKPAESHSGMSLAFVSRQTESGSMVKISPNISRTFVSESSVMRTSEKVTRGTLSLVSSSFRQLAARLSSLSWRSARRGLCRRVKLGAQSPRFEILASVLFESLARSPVWYQVFCNLPQIPWTRVHNFASLPKPTCNTFISR